MWQRISVSKERIRKTPLVTYKRMLQFILKNITMKNQPNIFTDVEVYRKIYFKMFLLNINNKNIIHANCGIKTPGYLY